VENLPGKVCPAEKERDPVGIWAALYPELEFQIKTLRVSYIPIEMAESGHFWKLSFPVCRFHLVHLIGLITS